MKLLLRRLLGHSHSHKLRSVTASEIYHSGKSLSLPDSDLCQALGLNRKSLQKHLVAVDFPPQLGSINYPERPIGAVATYASEHGLRFHNYLPGAAPLPQSARWRWHERLVLEDLEKQTDAHSAFSAIADICIPSMSLKGVATAEALIWVTPIWPANTTSLALYGINSLLGRLAALLPVSLHQEDGPFAVTVVLARVEDERFWSTGARSPFAEVLLNAGDPNSRHGDFFRNLLSPQQLAELTGMEMPAWPYGANLAHHVANHAWGSTVQVHDSPRFEASRTVFSYALEQFRSSGLNHFGALAVTTREFYRQNSRLPDTEIGTYRAATFAPLPLAEELATVPNDADLLLAAGLIHSDPDVEDALAESTRAIFGDPDYATPVYFPLEFLDPDYREKIIRTIQVNTPVEPLTPRLRWFFRKVRDHTDEDFDIVCVPIGASTLPAFVSMTSESLFWMPPNSYPWSDIADWSNAFKNVTDFLFLATPVEPYNTLPSGWGFEQDGRALPIPHRIDQAGISRHMIELFSGKAIEGPPPVLSGFEINSLDKHLEQRGRQVSISRTDLHRWVRGFLDSPKNPKQEEA